MSEAKDRALEELAWIVEGIAAGVVDKQQTILCAHREGATVAEIAVAAGMSRQGVTKALKRLGNSVDNGSGEV